MSGWVKAAWINPLFAAFDTRFPNRTKGSDGTIGDPAHAAGVSGHNPDDTPGVTAERQDADNIPEVRAGDVTNDLRDPDGYTMWDCVQAVLHGPADELNCLIYMICDGYIWRADNGWRQEKYNGTDQHWGHGHFSGHPDADGKVVRWTSIINLGKDGDMGGSFGPVQLERSGTTSLVIPPVEAGAADPRMTWLNVGHDGYGMPLGVRIYATNGDGKWFAVNGGDTGAQGDGLYVIPSGHVLSIQLPRGLRLLSISRKATTDAGTIAPDNPSPEMQVTYYSGSAAACFERK
jgi:hypothetical protein